MQGSDYSRKSLFLPNEWAVVSTNLSVISSYDLSALVSDASHVMSTSQTKVMLDELAAAALFTRELLYTLLNFTDAKFCPSNRLIEAPVCHQLSMVDWFGLFAIGM